MDPNVSFDGDWNKIKQIVKRVHNIKNQVQFIKEIHLYNNTYRPTILTGQRCSSMLELKKDHGMQKGTPCKLIFQPPKN